MDRLGPRSAFALGASVTVLDLPTAFPYFAAIAAIANSGAALPAQLALLGGFDLIYVSPLLAIAALPALAGHRWRAMAIRGRRAVDRFAAAAVAALTGLMGGALILRGAGGLLG